MKAKWSIPVIHARNLYQGVKEFEYLLKYPKQRLNILSDIFEMISGLDVVLISSVIDKYKYYKEYTDDAVEYRAWKFLFERCDMGLSDLCQQAGNRNESGLIIVDRNTSHEHDQIIRDYLAEIRLYGSEYHRFEYMIEEPLFSPSQWRNFIQLADAVAYCSVMKLLNYSFFIQQFSAIQSRFRASRTGDIKNYGFKVFPE
jgi:hypothetical protein